MSNRQDKGLAAIKNAYGTAIAIECRDAAQAGHDVLAALDSILERQTRPEIEATRSLICTPFSSRALEGELKPNKEAHQPSQGEV